MAAARKKPCALSLISTDPRMTLSIGESLGKILSPGAVLALQGSLGSGKTLFVRGLAKGLGIDNPEQINSPTFAIIQEYRGKASLCHADLYRLSPPEIRNLGLEEYCEEDSGWVVAVEWADRAEEFFPQSRTMTVRFKIISEKERTIGFSGSSEWKKEIQLLKKKF